MMIQFLILVLEKKKYATIFLSYTNMADCDRAKMKFEKLYNIKKENNTLKSIYMKNINLFLFPAKPQRRGKMEKKFKPQKSVSGTGNRFIDGMTKFFKLVSPKYLIGGTALLLFLAMLASCKKQGECADGIQYLNFNTESPTKSPSNDCDDERAARDSVANDLSTIHDPNVRNAIGPATNGIGPTFWAAFRGHFGEPYDPSNFTIIDTVYGIRGGVRDLRNTYGDPLPSNDAEIKILYDFCGKDSVEYDVLQDKEKALYDCENGVGIDEWKWVEDPNNPCIRIWQKVR